jgi:NAD(P)-dependent dehydrogenase (short-subunit alcohol dehydrogenase family)
MTIAKTILITGASSGIGRATAAHLASKGCHVFGTSRRPAVETMDGFELLPLDVTDETSVQTCLNAVLERAGNLDVLVNNAGVDLMGPIEETSLEEANWIFDTNFFGAVRMTKAVLPHMRARRSGQIINISSALGLAAWPFEAFYCASKHALEGYTESLRYEMSIFNVKVSSVQPGFYQTSIAQRQRLARASIRDYDGPRERAIQWFNKWVEEGSAPLPVARTVQRIIESRSPRLRYAVGLEAVLAPKLAHILPERILLWAGRRMLGV